MTSFVCLTITTQGNVDVLSVFLLYFILKSLFFLLPAFRKKVFVSLQTHNLLFWWPKHVKANRLITDCGCLDHKWLPLTDRESPMQVFSVMFRLYFGLFFFNNTAAKSSSPTLVKCLTAEHPENPAWITTFLWRVCWCYRNFTSQSVFISYEILNRKKWQNAQ